MTTAAFLTFSLYAAIVMVMMALALAFVRMLLGPTLGDRVVALDMMTTVIIAICGLVAIVYDVSAFLDVALVVALIGFLSTVALARYAERRDPGDKDQADD